MSSDFEIMGFAPSKVALGPPWMGSAGPLSLRRLADSHGNVRKKTGAVDSCGATLLPTLPTVPGVSQAFSALNSAPSWSVTRMVSVSLPIPFRSQDLERTGPLADPPRPRQEPD